MTAQAPPAVLVTVPNRPVPSLPAAPTGDLARLVAVWDRCVAPVLPGGGDGDFEDWVESAYRLLAAVDVAGPERVYVRTTTHTRRASTGEIVTPSDVALVGGVDLGMIPGRHAQHANGPERIASNYARLDTFRRHAGRPVELAGALTGGDHDVEAVIARMHAATGRRVFVKGTTPKSLTAVVEPGQTLADVLEDHWILVRREGDRDVFLVQGWTPMRWETRFLVADHEPVTGAGQVIEHTPLDNIGVAFNPLLRAHRDDHAPDHGGPVTAEPGIMLRLTGFARRVAGQLAVEVPALTEYALDVAVGPDGHPLIVELNGIANAGLFACQPHLLTRARLNAHARASRGGKVMDP